MQTLTRSVMLLVIFGAASWAQVGPGNRGRFGIGYDEGIAGRFFFANNMGVQASIGFQHLGGYNETATPPVPPAVTNYGSENDISFAGAFVYNFIATQWVYFDALGQIAVANHDAPDPNNYNDHTDVFLRFAGAPEILIGDRLGLGFRFGLEFAFLGRTTLSATTIQDGRTNIRFFGPANPFGSPSGVLGMSLYVYFGKF